MLLDLLPNGFDRLCLLIRGELVINTLRVTHFYLLRMFLSSSEYRVFSSVIFNVNSRFACLYENETGSDPVEGEMQVNKRNTHIVLLHTYSYIMTLWS